MRKLLIPIFLAALAAPQAASAATVSMSASAGPASETYIDYRAGKKEANKLVVKKSGKFVYFTETGAKTLTAKPDKIFGNCVKTAKRTARCPSATAIVSLKDGNDRVSFDYKGKGDDAIPTDPTKLADEFEDTEGGFSSTTIVDGGDGDDVIGGTPFADSISPGPGTDRVNAGGGGDTVNIRPDGKRDVLKGDAGLNTLDFFVQTGPVQIDTRAGIAASGSDRDVIRGFRRIFGGPGNDVLRGGDAGEAFYGAGGTDDIDGRGGDDYLSGDLPVSSPYFPDTIAGGAGDDVIDVRDRPLKPTSTVDCGPGNDRVAAQEDDRLVACESSAFADYFNLTDTDFERGTLNFELLTPVAPTARGADGAPTYDIPCPGGKDAQPCSGTVFLTRPPTAGGPNPDLLGQGMFTMPAGERRQVAITLNPQGVAALAAPGTVLSVHVRGSIAPPASPPGQGATLIDYGWQTAF